jgi:hypothetical protein
MGIFDNALDPQTAGLLAAAFQGLQASGPSRMPVSMGQIIGQAGGAGLESYNSAIKARQAAQMLQAQQEHIAAQNRLLGAQVTEKEQEAAKKRRIEDFYKNEAPKYVIQEPALSNVERSLEGGGGPTEENAGILSAMPPAPKGILNRIDMPGLLSAAVGAGIESPAKLYEFQAGLEEKVNARKDRMESLRLQIIDRNQRAQDSADLRRDLATESNNLRREIAEGQRTTQLSISANRQPVAPTMKDIVDPTDPTRLLSVDARTYIGGTLGSPGVLGIAGREPTYAKRLEKEQQGTEQVKSSVDDLRAAFTTLKDAGAIPSSEAGSLSNAGAWTRSSTVGQIGGRIIGSKEQDSRNQIQSGRLQLLNAIKNATGMSAQQLNSNVELKTWLDSLTSLSNSYESNIKILDAIERKYSKPQSRTGTGSTGGWAIVR